MTTATENPASRDATNVGSPREAERPNKINLQEIADRAEERVRIARGSWNTSTLIAVDDLAALISELQKAREALECISSLSTQPHGQWAERWPEWEKHRLAMMAEREYRGVIVLNNLFGSIARQALSPAPAGSPPTSGGGDE